MHSTGLIAVFAILAAVAVNGRNSVCPRMTNLQSYDPSKGIGTWYVIAYSTCSVTMPNVNCQVMTFRPKDDGTADLEITATDLKTNSKITFDGTVTGDKNSSATFHLKGGSGTYTSIDTDYDNYAISVNELTVNGIPGTILLVFGREKEITDPNIVKKYKQAMSKFGFDPDDLQQMAQTGCSTD